MVKNIEEFIRPVHKTNSRRRLKTGLLVTSTNHDLQSNLLQELQKSGDGEVITLEATQATSLPTALKTIIRNAITQRDGIDFYQSFISDNKRLLPIVYDLELLQTYLDSFESRNIVISIANVETFGTTILCELIQMLSGWSDRIPFVLILGIATTIELFEIRLSRSILRLLDAQTFELTDRTISYHDLFTAAQGRDYRGLIFGRGVCKLLYDRSEDQDATVKNFVDGIRYCYMSHFFGNSVAVLLDEKLPLTAQEIPYLAEAIRNLDSFRDLAEDLLESDPDTLRELVDDDKAMMAKARELMTEGQSTWSQHLQAVSALLQLISLLGDSLIALSSFDLKVECMSGYSTLDVTLQADIFDAAKRLNSAELAATLTSMRQQTTSNTTLNSLLELTLDNLESITSDHPDHVLTPQPTTTSTTPRKPTPRQQYTTLLTTFLTRLQSHFESHIINPSTLPLHEILVFDIRSPLSTTFTPRPRFALERALGRPGDYLGCACCATAKTKEVTIDHLTPPTSVLWNLWCEAGAIVNIRDLWEAFGAVLLSGQKDDEEVDGADEEIEQVGDDGNEKERNDASAKMTDKLALALFYRGLAELRYFGFVKGTKKKADCLAKGAWRGL